MGFAALSDAALQVPRAREFRARSSRRERGILRLLESRHGGIDYKFSVVVRLGWHYAGRTSTLAAHKFARSLRIRQCRGPMGWGTTGGLPPQADLRMRRVSYDPV